jgi:hypothetical protein
LKALLKRKYIIIPLIAVVLALTISGIALAVNSLIIAGQANVAKASYDIEVYADAACTIPITPPLTWSTLPTGESRSRTVYVKNTGNSDALVTPSLNATNYGITLEKTSVTVARGGSASLTLVLDANPNSVIGTSALTITLNSVQASQATTTTTTAP